MDAELHAHGIGILIDVPTPGWIRTTTLTPEIKVHSADDLMANARDVDFAWATYSTEALVGRLRKAAKPKGIISPLNIINHDLNIAVSDKVQYNFSVRLPTNYYPPQGVFDWRRVAEVGMTYDGVQQAGCYASTGRNGLHHYYACTNRAHRGKGACHAPYIPAVALEQAIITRLIELSRDDDAREKIINEAIGSTHQDIGRIRDEIGRVRQRAALNEVEINNLLMVLKQLGSDGLTSVGEELRAREAERRDLGEHLRKLAEEEAALRGVSDVATDFITNWRHVGSLFAKATAEERRSLLQHLVEVIEWKATGTDGRTGTYVLRLLPGEERDDGGDVRGDGGDVRGPGSDVRGPGGGTNGGPDSPAKNTIGADLSAPLTPVRLVSELTPRSKPPYEPFSDLGEDAGEDGLTARRELTRLVEGSYVATFQLTGTSTGRDRTGRLAGTTRNLRFAPSPRSEVRAPIERTVCGPGAPPAGRLYGVQKPSARAGFDAAARMLPRCAGSTIHSCS